MGLGLGGSSGRSPVKVELPYCTFVEHITNERHLKIVCPGHNYRVILVVSNKLLLTVSSKIHHMTMAASHICLVSVSLPKKYRAGSGTTIIQSTKVCC